MIGTDLAHAAALGLRRSLPALTVLLALLLDLLPAPRTGPQPVAPSLLLSVAYYWLALRPELLPTGVLFLLGLVADAAGGQPLGLTPLALLAGHVAVAACRRLLYLRAFGGLWIGFAAMLATSELVAWLVASLWQARLLSLQPAFAEATLSLAAFPAVAWLLSLLLTLLPAPVHAPGR
ncbi:rod shape-determining protein MreD [Marinimicrococcus flavescens]|uniref:Rod shape-determining protein MreD n=1 Tax=Marinimicrococcus flavescens TaxID=3031815 RepID=A0AAP3XPH8_9PROT|nr:rod shape-determining protein MreD [Marinimicrococcus flavescens]